MTVDDRLVERFRLEQAANGRNLEPQPEPPLEPGGGGGDSGGMDGIGERVTRVEVRLDGVEHRLGGVEARMDRLEGRMDRLETRMDGIDTRLRGVEQGLARISGQLDLLTTQIVAKLPSWWQMPAVIAATVTLLAALWAAGKALGARGFL